MVTILDDEKINGNTLAKTTIDLTKNIGIQDNGKHHLELQREVGAISPYMNGKNIDTLRQEKRKKRHTSPCKENCHLKPSVVEQESNIVAPSCNDRPSKTKRWYDNSLGDEYSIILLTVSTLSFTEEITLKRIDKLKNKFLRRLINGTSPTSEILKNISNAVVTNKSGVKEILSIASEIFCADMEEIVNTCKQILMDNNL